MSIDQSLLDILACPEDKGPLWYIESEKVLFNPRLRRGYSVVDGIPVMLIGEARTFTDVENDKMTGFVESLGIKPTFES